MRRTLSADQPMKTYVSALPFSPADARTCGASLCMPDERGDAVRMLATCAVVAVATMLAACCGERVEPARGTLLTADSPLPTVSGLAPFGDATFVAVHDVRIGEANGGLVADRLSVLAIGPSGVVTRRPVSLEVGSLDVPRDLEAIAAIPGTPGQFLLLESGGEGGARRLFTCALSPDAVGGHRARLIAPPLDLRRYLAGLSNVEGLCVLPVAGETGQIELLITDRGEVGMARADGGRSGIACCPDVQLVGLTLKDGEVLSSREWEFAGPKPPDGCGRTTSDASWRMASDLMIGPDHEVYLSSASDPGRTGPFRSLVSRVGSFGPNGFVPADVISSVRIDGHKVEALCLFPLSPPGQWRMLVGCDDEALGGMILRIEPPSPSPNRLR